MDNDGKISARVDPVMLDFIRLISKIEELYSECVLEFTNGEVNGDRLTHQGWHLLMTIDKDYWTPDLITDLTDAAVKAGCSLEHIKGNHVLFGRPVKA